MKKLIRIQQFCLIITLSIFTISCSDDDEKVTPGNGGGNPQTEEGTLSATIDGVDKNSVLVSSFESSFGTITISGQFDQMNDEALGITVKDTASTGTYDLLQSLSTI
jgi:hypothetical protein